MKKEIILISIGGSLVVPNQIDCDFLVNIKKLIVGHIRKEKRFVISVGGGSVCRMYQNAARSVSGATEKALDLLGIQVTEVNAELLKILFEPDVHKTVITNPTRAIHFRNSVLIAAGWKPGCSTDMAVVLLAQQLNIAKLINLTNRDFVYDKDPRTEQDAKPIRSISWKEYRKIIPLKWRPGLHAPFDPTASRMAQKLRLEVVIMNGKNLGNIDRYLSGNDFIGTRIHP